MMLTHVVESEQNSLNSLFPEFANWDQSLRQLKQFAFLKSNLGYGSYPGEAADDTNNKIAFKQSYLVVPKGKNEIL